MVYWWIAGYLGIYFLAFYLAFFHKIELSKQPVLKERFGTTISHTSDRGGEGHIYCYYPSKAYHQEGEYILKRVDKIDDCSGWYGITILYEDRTVSEREKMDFRYPDT